MGTGCNLNLTLKKFMGDLTLLQLSLTLIKKPMGHFAHNIPALWVYKEVLLFYTKGKC